MDLGIVGAREGGLYVTVETRSRRYSKLRVEGPGREIVREIGGADIRLVRA
jgi:hypothetical protein